MKIEKCHIENFGRLHDLDISFEDGLNQICAENGAGKSTFSAFIRAMLYGFEGDGKRNLENERKRYTPWQGGPFGGSMTFSANGKSYKVIRKFADKAKGDEFLLYDAQTNLPSSDYTENLGEELFLIDKNTFERTVFIEAGDCEAAATGDINKLIGNLTEDSNDINNFESANTALKDLENKLSGTRKTGELYKRKAGITTLKKEIAEGANLAESIGKREKMLGEYAREIEEYKSQLSEITAKQKKEAAKVDLRSKADEYKMLCKNVQQAKDDFKNARCAFPGDVPDDKKIDEYIGRCEDLNELGGQYKANSLSEEEKNKLALYSRNFRYNTPDAKTIESIRGRAEELNEIKENENTADNALPSSSRVPIILIIIGAVAAACGIAAFAFAGALPGGIILCIAVLLLLFGIIKLAKDKQKYSALLQQMHSKAEEKQNRAKLLEKELSGFFASYNFTVHEKNFSAALAGLESAAGEYNRLIQKQKLYSELLKEYTKEQEKTVSFIKEYSWQADPNRSLMQQIIDIRKAHDKYKTSGKQLANKKQEKETFEKTHDMDALKQVQETDAPSLGDLQDEKTGLDEKIEGLNKNILNIQNEADRLREKYDEWTEKKENLKVEQESFKKLEHKYVNIKNARKFLEAAKVSLIKKYTDPILESFRNYFGCFSEETGKSIQIDANLDISREEFGIPRKTETQSSGYQDMMGFCLRAAYVDAMYLGGDVQREMPVLVLDDPFMALDGENSKAAGKLLSQLAGKYQVIYFTCSPGRKYNQED